MNSNIVTKCAFESVTSANVIGNNEIVTEDISAIWMYETTDKGTNGPKFATVG